MRTLFNKSNSHNIIKEIEDNIQKLQTDSENIMKICDIITIILGYMEIDKFKVIIILLLFQNDKITKYF